MHDELHQRLLMLRLNGMDQALDSILGQAEQAAHSPAEVIRRLLNEEHRHRQERSFLVSAPGTHLRFPLTER